MFAVVHIPSQEIVDLCGDFESSAWFRDKLNTLGKCVRYEIRYVD